LYITYPGYTGQSLVRQLGGLYRFDGQNWKPYLTGDIIPDERMMGSFPGNVAAEMTVRP
jgi:hypothetical protein